MKNILIILFVISLILTIGGVLIIFIKGKMNNRLRYFPLIAIVFLLTMVMAMVFYYSNELENQREVYMKLLTEQPKPKLGNKTGTELKQQIDSIKLYEIRVQKLIAGLKKQYKITGKGEAALDSAVNLLKTTQTNIVEIRSYNEVVSSDILLKNMKGSMSSGQTSNFEYSCPPTSDSANINIVLRFLDEKLVDKIGCMIITVCTERLDGNFDQIFEETYLPQKGINMFSVRNYLKTPRLRLDVGYILKDQLNLEYPRIEKVTCKYNY